jgi:hypothetical protein
MSLLLLLPAHPAQMLALLTFHDGGDHLLVTLGLLNLQQHLLLLCNHRV